MNKKRFRNASNVSLWLGGSETHMAAIVRELDLTSRKALFWLDGHYSGGVTGRTEHDCPLWFELEAIKGSGRNDHVVIIDDARCFPKDPSNLSGHEDAAYPEIGMVIQRLKAINPHYDVKIENDNIIAIAKSTH